MIDCDVMKFWKGKFTHDYTRDYKISICIGCMNRLEDIRRTLPANIKAEAAYPNVEFVLLDYNSTDGLQHWVKSYMAEHIDSGKLVYYRTEQPRYYHFSHAKNVAFKLATGDIVCNLDADNYTFTNNEQYKSDECWTSYINHMANDCSEKLILARGKRINHGRVGFYRDEFIHVLGGYDERMTHYGQEDYDIVRRAWHLGFIMYWWGPAYADRIITPKPTRIMNLDMGKYKTYEKMCLAMRKLGEKNMAEKRYKVNTDHEWGQAIVTKNFNTGEQKDG